MFSSLLGYVFVTLLNLFFWDRDPVKCASLHGDRHLHKMILEYAQIASTAYRLVSDGVIDGDNVVYRKVQATSNVVQWAAASHAHFVYVVRLGLALGEERQRRRKPSWKVGHASEPCLQWLLQHGYPIYFPDDEWLCDPPLRMPDCCKVDRHGVALDDAVRAYQMYAAYKVHTIKLSWPTTPAFVTECLKDIEENRPDIQASIQEVLEKKHKVVKRRKVSKE